MTERAEERLGRPMLRARYGNGVPIERGFVRLAHGDMHYRMGGDGPVVVALHESPRSSLSLLPLIDALAHERRVIAPDSPGYGLSDALAGDHPSMDDFVAALAAFLDGLGLSRVAFYGAHTGAAIASAFAAKHPERVTALVLDGLSVFTPHEVEAFETRYLTPYAPDWAGGHIMGVWSRVKDLFTWFPWYDQSASARLRTEPLSLDALNFSALGFLQSGRHYAKAYIRAAAFQPDAVLERLSMPTTVMARPDDLIADHLDRLQQGPGWEIAWLKPGIAAWTEALNTALSKGSRPDDRLTIRETDVGSLFVPIGNGYVHVVLAGPRDGPVRLLLPDFPGDLTAFVRQETKRFQEARLVALSLPGCGWSDPLSVSTISLHDAVSVLDQTLSHLELDPTAMTASGAAAVVAQLLAERRNWSFPVERLNAPAWLDHPELLGDNDLLQPLPPRWDGAHLTGAWFQLRDLALYDVPPGVGAPVRRREPLDLEAIEDRFRSFVQGPECADLLRLVVAHVRTTRKPAHTIATAP
jgi:pimeloyl-ACP methyl ester carboxylesterase